MAETIEAFVAKLQAEGVQAGKQAAQKLRAEAQGQADEIVRKAQDQAEKLLADARAEAEALRERARAELNLAARDSVLRLRETLSRALQAVLTHSVDRQLSEPDFLAKLLHEVVQLYAKADCERQGRIRIDLPEEMRQKLVGWALRELGQERMEAIRGEIDLKGTLKTAGFEYQVRDSTVEVTTESVVGILSEMVTPALREVIRKATEDDRPKANG